MVVPCRRNDLDVLFVTLGSEVHNPKQCIADDLVTPDKRGSANQYCARLGQILDLFAEDDRLNVYAGELEVRPRGAPTTTAAGASPPSQPVLVVRSLSLGTFRVDLSSTVSIQ
jgi:hypothetical protein